MNAIQGHAMNIRQPKLLAVSRTESDEMIAAEKKLASALHLDCRTFHSEPATASEANTIQCPAGMVLTSAGISKYLQMSPLSKNQRVEIMFVKFNRYLKYSWFKQ